MTGNVIRWFVLPPTQNLETLRSALRDHAQAQGLSVVEVVMGGELVNPDDIVLTSDLDFASLAGASCSNATVLDLSPFIDLSDCAPENIPHRVLDESRKIAAARAFEGCFSSVDTGLPWPFADLAIPQVHSRKSSALEGHYQNALAVLTRDSAEWSPEIFSYASGDGGSNGTGVVDITGRPRLVVFGPYVFLPRGVWRVTVRVSFDKDAAQKLYQIQWGGGETHVAYDFTPGTAGVYEITLDHAWPKHGASEVRLMLMEGAFHGTLRLHGATVQRLS